MTDSGGLFSMILELDSGAGMADTEQPKQPEQPNAAKPPTGSIDLYVRRLRTMSTVGRLQ